MTVDNDIIRTLAASVITSVLAENLVFARSFGVTPMIAAAKDRKNFLGVCLGVVYFTTVSSAFMWAAMKLPFVAGADKYALGAVYTVIIGIVYVITLMCAFLLVKSRFSRIKKYVHISAFNSAVMGTIFMSASLCTTLKEYLFFGLCAGAGFTLASYMLSGVCGQLYSKDVPNAFRGYPAVMVYTGIMAMAVFGILGHSPVY